VAGCGHELNFDGRFGIDMHDGTHIALLQAVSADVGVQDYGVEFFVDHASALGISCYEAR
jgi:hypothetical protein